MAHVLPTCRPPLIDGVDDNDNLDPKDVIFQVEATLPYTRFMPGDTVIWRWTGSGVGGSTGGEIDVVVAGQISFSVERQFVDLNNNGTIRFGYTLIRGLDTLRSEVLEVTVGKALGVLPRPEVLEASRHPDELRPESATVKATIEVSFPTMSPEDRILAVWSGLPDIGTHEETQFGNTFKTVHFDVHSDVIGASILPEGRVITVQYFVLRGTRKIPSPILLLQLLPLTTLPIPTIEGQDNPILNIARLNGLERTLINKWEFSHPDQLMWMEYEGEYDDGERFFEATYTANLVTSDGAMQGIMPPTPVDKLRKLKNDSFLKIRFWVSFDRSSDRSHATLFRVREYVVQAVPGVLPHPFIGGASGVGPEVTVDPLPIEHNTTVTVRYDGMRSTDKITLSWFFHDCTEEQRTLDGQDGGTVVFNLTSAGFLNYSVNSTVQLKYSVLREGSPEPTPSEVQTVQVNTIPAIDLPAPLINNIANNGVINLPTISGNPNSAVAKWPLSAKDQYVWLYCIAGDNVLTVIDGEPIDGTEAANGLTNKPVLRTWLAALVDNTSIRVVLKVAYTRANDVEQAVVFSETLYTVKTVRPIALDESRMFVNLGGWLLQGFGYTDVVYTGTVRQASGGEGTLSYSSSNTSVAIVDNSANRGRLTFTGTGTTTITVRDQKSQSKSYDIQVSGGGRICRLVGNGTFDQMLATIGSLGGSMLTYGTASSLNSRFATRFPRTGEAWVNEGVPPISPTSRYLVRVYNGQGIGGGFYGNGNFDGYGIF